MSNSHLIVSTISTTATASPGWDPTQWSFEQMTRFLELTGISTNNPREVRLFGGASSASHFGLFTSSGAAAAALLPYIGHTNIYVGVNRARAEYLSRAANTIVPATKRTTLPAGADLSRAPICMIDDEVPAATMLYVDVDSIRSTKQSDCATDEELGHAIELRNRIAADLLGIGVQAIGLNSGNGSNLVVLLEPPVINVGSGRIARVLMLLKQRYETPRAAVDIKVGNPSRVMRMPGTLNLKTPGPGRPQRYAYLEHEGAAPMGADLDVIEQWLTATATSTVGRSPADARARNAGGGGQRDIGVSAGEFAHLLGAWQDAALNGDRHELALGLSGAMRKAGHDREVTLRLVSRLAAAANDEEAPDRLRTVEDTYARDSDAVSGWAKLRQLELDPVDFPSLRPDERSEPGSAAAEIVAIGRELRLLRDQYDECFAHVPMSGGRLELYPIRGRRFARYLASIFFKRTGKAVGSNTIAAAATILEGVASEYPKVTLWNRIARDDEGRLWIDLVDNDGRAISIEHGGWRVSKEPPAIFRRYAHQEPLDLPVTGGNAWQLLKYVPISSVFDQWVFVVATIASLIPDIAQPITILHGAQGSAKTTTARFRRALLDPSAADTMPLRRDLAELIQALAHNYAPIIDNVSSLAQEQSNLLCQVSTGGGYSKRRLFSDDEDVVYSFIRPVTLTCLNAPGSEADFLDRALLIRLDRVSPDDRKEERELWTQFKRDRPSILGGMLDALVKAIRIYPEIRLDQLPRMADFARWATAIAVGMGIPQPDFTKVLWNNISRQADEIIDTDMVAAAINWFARNMIQLQSGPLPGLPGGPQSTSMRAWEGSASQLLDALRKAPGVNVDAREWPKDPAVLGKKLVALMAPLSAVGVHIERSKSGQRSWRIQLEG